MIGIDLAPNIFRTTGWGTFASSSNFFGTPWSAHHIFSRNVVIAILQNETTAIAHFDGIAIAIAQNSNSVVCQLPPRGHPRIS